MRKHYTDECKKGTAEEQVPLLNMPRPRKSFFSIHGTQDPHGAIADEHAAKPIASFSDLMEMRKEGGGDPSKDHALAFDVSGRHSVRLCSCSLTAMY